MSKVHDELSSDAREHPGWYLQVDGEELYGPVSLGELKQWAQQGRIAPGNRLSQDRKRWREAASIEALGMDWLVELPDGGSYGPVCRELIPELVKQGMLEADMTAESRRTGQRQTLARFTRPAPRTTRLQPELPLDGSAIPAPVMTDLPPEALAPEPESEAPSDAPDTVPEADDTRHDPEADADTILAPEPDREPAEDHPESPGGEALTQRLQTLQRSAKQARTQLAETRRELMQQRADNTALQDRLRKLEDDLQAAEKLRRQSETALTEQEDRAAHAEAETENLLAQLEQLQNHFDRLQVESQEQFELLDRTRAELMELEQTSNQERAEFESRMNTKTGLLQQAIGCILRDPDVQTAELPERLLETPREQLAVQKLAEQLDQMRDRLRQAEDRAAAADAAAERGSVRPGGTILRIAAALLLAAVAAAIGYRYGGNRADASGRPPDAGRHGTGVPDSPPALHPGPAANRRDRQTNAAAPDWPSLDLPRTNLRVSDRGFSIVYTYGLFERGETLAEQAVEDLALLAEAIRPHLERFSLVIEGHTDTTPLATGDDRYADNFALGTARATAVSQRLQRWHNIPEYAILTTSAGDADPPYSNDTETSRRQNRTVVFHLRPKR